MNEKEYNQLRNMIARFVSINGIRRSARMLNVSPNTLQRFLAMYPIRPSSLEKIRESFKR